MPTALITPEALYEQAGPHVDRLVGAGFEVKYPEDSTFTGEDLRKRRSPGWKDRCDPCRWRAVDGRGAGRLPGLRVFARCGVGFDKVDIPAATRLGRVVTITPTANHAAVAEQALALLFGVSKRVAIHDKLVRSGGWSTEPMRPIRGQTMGIFGLGRIGRSMAVRCASLGMTVIATEKYPDEAFCSEQGIELVDFDTCFPQRRHQHSLPAQRRNSRSVQRGRVVKNETQKRVDQHGTWRERSSRVTC
ncbi:MAG: hypothetical protein Ct9H300mP1_24090 [Planctomycetaceae bacterium]|nr:MAG: hypothetical protein Ct9H300mP1_24090 [Planctomycetaceae bacterium]